MPVKQLADQIGVHCRQPEHSRIIQVCLATEQRYAQTHAGHLVGGGVLHPLCPLLSGRATHSLGRLQDPVSPSLVLCPGAAFTSQQVLLSHCEAPADIHGGLLDLNNTFTRTCQEELSLDGRVSMGPSAGFRTESSLGGRTWSVAAEGL